MTAAERELRGLATLLQLEKDARHADTLERLGFIIVNDTRQLLRYHQAVLWAHSPAGGIRLLTFSGLAAPDKTSPYYNWIKGFVERCASQGNAGSIRALSETDLPEKLSADWHEWLPGPVLWCPLTAPGGQSVGGVLLARDTPWQTPEIKLMERLCDAYAHAWAGLQGRRPGWGHQALSALLGRRAQLLMLLLAALAMVVPVRESVLAPAEVTPIEPEVASSPVEGVVKEILVSPNAEVHKGDLLFELDDTQVRNRHEIAKRSLAVARADYLRASQKAFSDPKSKSELALLKAKVEEKEAEADYTAELIQRMQVRAGQDGIAVFTDPNDWMGRPVAVGERVMLIADPARSELEIHLAVEDAINLEPGAGVLFFLNIRPTHPLTARLFRSSYEAQAMTDGTLAFRLKASFDKDEAPPRIGLRGTAKVYGERVSLFYYLMRRPLAVLRRTFGL